MVQKNWGVFLFSFAAVYFVFAFYVTFHHSQLRFEQRGDWLNLPKVAYKLHGEYPITTATGTAAESHTDRNTGGDAKPVFTGHPLPPSEIAQLMNIGRVWGGGGGADFAWPKSVLYDQCVHPNEVLVCVESRKKFIILFYDKLLMDEYPFVQIPPSDQLLHFGCCNGVDMVYTMDRKFLPIADVVEFNARQFPDPLPERGHKNQLFMVFSSEAVYTVRDFEPYRHMNLVRTFSRDSDIQQPYSPTGECACREILKPLRVSFAERHTVPVAALISNCHSYAKREDLLLYMINKMPVHSFGSCFHNRDLDNKTAVPEQMKYYKYVLAIENAVCRDYMSEKFYRTFQWQSVPIVFAKGNQPAYEELAPAPDSYVNLGSFLLFDQAIGFIMETAASEQSYMQHHQFRGLPPSSKLLGSKFREICSTSVDDITQWCKLAERARNPDGLQQLLKSTWSNYKKIASKSCFPTGAMQSAIPAANWSGDYMYDMNDPNRKF